MAGRLVSTMLVRRSHVQHPCRAPHAGRKSRPRNKQPIGERENTAAKEIKSSASHIETTFPQIKPPLPRTKVPPTKLLKALFLSPVLLVIFNY